jgi:hypothetical protein
MIFIQANIKVIKDLTSRLLVKYFIGFLLIAGLSSCATPTVKSTPTDSPTQTPIEVQAVQTPKPALHQTGVSRGYLTTPQELKVIAKKAEQGIEPYQSAVNDVLQWANEDWNYEMNARENCSSPDRPGWNDNGKGTPVLYAKALAYHLSGEVHYAEEVKNILERIMTQVESISIDTERCWLVFGWGTPELVASADLIEDYWWDQTCTGPTGIRYEDTRIRTGNCKRLFQHWLVKNPYYVVSYSAESSKSNWGAAATNTLAHIADYLWDRPDITLVHRNPPLINDGKDSMMTPSEAYAHANKLALDRMNGYGVEYGSSTSCDYLSGVQQNTQWPPVKSQITEMGIIPEDARRQEYCNIPSYNGEYQNYPQIHLGSNIQQCELMLRRGDASCYDNVDNSDISDYEFVGPDGEPKTTHLYPGRGSIERAIKAIIVDSHTEWRHDSALEVAFRYYFTHHTLSGFELWEAQLDGQPHECSPDVCFGGLTHGFSIEDESPGPPPTVPPP